MAWKLTEPAGPPSFTIRLQRGGTITHPRATTTGLSRASNLMSPIPLPILATPRLEVKGTCEYFKISRMKLKLR